jgi:hypothetical protein
VPLPAARPETVALNAPGGTPDTTASIPADAGRTVTRQAQPERAQIREQVRKPDHKQARTHRETARERAKREYLARQYARERAAYLARERLRTMSPSEKRRLYFENLERQRRRDTRFTDIWR